MRKTPYEMQPGILFFWPMKWNGNILFGQYRIEGRPDCKHREKNFSETKRMPLPNLLPLLSPLAEQRHRIEKDFLNSWNLDNIMTDWLRPVTEHFGQCVCIKMIYCWLWLLTLLVFNLQVPFIVIKVGFGVKFLDKLKFRSLNSHGNLWPIY